jgi:hypothetical protein
MPRPPIEDQEWLAQKPARPDPRAVAFFMSNAGYSYDPQTETPKEGRRRCAEQLAHAESNARERGISFKWITDDCTSQEFSNRRPYYALWLCGAYDREGVLLTTLGAIDFGRNDDPWSSSYRRVVEAELACECTND